MDLASINRKIFIFASFVFRAAGKKPARHLPALALSAQSERRFEKANAYSTRAYDADVDRVRLGLSHLVDQVVVGCQPDKKTKGELR